jgi:hypothetical protein
MLRLHPALTDDPAMSGCPRRIIHDPDRPGLVQRGQDRNAKSDVSDRDVSDTPPSPKQSTPRNRFSHSRRARGTATVTCFTRDGLRQRYQSWLEDHPVGGGFAVEVGHHTVRQAKLA